MPAVSAAHANRGSSSRASRGGSTRGSMGSSHGGPGGGGGYGGGGGAGLGGLLEPARPLALSHHLDDGVGLGLQLTHRGLDAAGRAQAGGAWFRGKRKKRR